MRGNESRTIALCVVALGLGSHAAAQTAAGARWEVEFHGGGNLLTSPTGGTVSLPGPGAVFTTATANPTESRREPSWYFGDGALLFNQAVEALAQLPGR